MSLNILLEMKDDKYEESWPVRRDKVNPFIYSVFL